MYVPNWIYNSERKSATGNLFVFLEATTVPGKNNSQVIMHTG